MSRQDDPTHTSTGTPSDPALEDTAAGDPSVTPGHPGRSLGAGARIGRYEILEVLGSGGMGVVYRARDPDLDRELAIKVVQPQAAGPRAQERLLEEARAMAKLRHPAVVPVFDVGAFAGQVYVVMPLLTGGTLHDWIHAEPRPWREVVTRFIAAGRGLAAAHAAGLIHRDFKPRNVLLGEAGEVIVADLGIAAHTTASGDSLDGTEGLPGQAQVSSIAGTPAYMAPEQASGAAIDARADQFSFCVSLWEGLHGERPDQAETRTANGVTARVPRVPDARRDAPGWLLAAVARGFAPAAELRWPSMTALCDHLERRLRRPRRAILAAAAGVVAVGAAATAAFALQGSGGAAADPCPDPIDRIEQIWNPEVKARVSAAFTATGASYAAGAIERAFERLDLTAAEWRKSHVETCRANHDGRQSDTLFDLRMTCLGDLFDELDGTVALLAKVHDRESLDRASSAIRTLGFVDACTKVEQLERTKHPPPEKREAAAAIRREVLAVTRERMAGNLKGLPEQIDALVVRAREVNHPTTLASALKEQVYLLREIREIPRIRPVLEELAHAASQGGHDPTAAYAWSELYLHVGNELGLVEEATKLLPVAKAAVARAGDPIDLTVVLLRNESMVIDNTEPARAIALLEQARQVLIDRVDPANPPHNLVDLRLAVAAALGGAQGAAGDYAASERSFREAIAAAVSQIGPDHPRMAGLHSNLGETLRRAGKNAESLGEYLEAARILEASTGGSPTLVRTWERIGGLHIALDRQAESLPWFEKAIALADQKLAPDDPARLGVLSTYALALRELGRRDEALVRFDEVIAAWERVKTNPGSLRSALHNRGGTHRELLHWQQSVADYQRAIAMYEGPDDHRILNSLVGLGHTYLEWGKPAKAIPWFERAAKIERPQTGLALQRVARWLLGRARVESGKDVARGFAEVAVVRAELVAAGGEEVEIADLDAWVAKARKR